MPTSCQLQLPVWVERGSWGDGSNQCPAERDPSLSSVPLRACWSSIPRCRQPVILPPPKHTRLTGGKHSRRPSSVITGEPWHSGERHATAPHWREGKKKKKSHFQIQSRPLNFLPSRAKKTQKTGFTSKVFLAQGRAVPATVHVGILMGGCCHYMGAAGAHARKLPMASRRRPYE